MELFVIIFCSYLIGSIPFGYLLTKLFLKKDIRDIGSGNIGATNALRTGNKAVGYGTLTLDILNDYNKKEEIIQKIIEFKEKLTKWKVSVKAPI